MGDDTTPIYSNDSVSARLAEIDHIVDASEKVKALVELAFQLLPSSSEVLEKALDAAHKISEEKSCAYALAAIIPQLSKNEPQLLKKALTLVQTIQDEKYRANTLALIIPLLPDIEPQLLEQALTVAQSIQNANSRANMLALIAPLLPDTEPQLLEQALTAAQSILDDCPRAKALAAIAPQLSEIERFKVLEQALKSAQSILFENNRADALVLIAPLLPGTEPQLLEQALAVAQSIQNANSRAKALAAVAPQLSEIERFKVLEQALKSAQSIQDVYSRADALAAIAPQLPEIERFKVLEQALKSAQSIQDEALRTDILAAIVLQLPETELHLLEQSLTIAQSIQNAYFRTKALAVVALQLPEEQHLLEQALTAAESIQDEYSRAKALVLIAPQFPETERLKVLKQALTATQSFHDGKYRPDVSAVITPQLPEAERLKVLKQVLTATLSFQKMYSDDVSTAAMDSIWSISIDPQVVEKFQTDIQSCEDEIYRISALAATAPQLPETERFKVLEQSLTDAQSISNEGYRSKALAAVIPQLPETEPHLLEQALTVAQEIQSEVDRANTLAVIAPQLPQTHLTQLLGAISGLSQQLAAKVLTSPAIRLTEALANQFPIEKHLVALEIVKDLPQDADKTKFLSALAPRLSIGLFPNALRLIQDTFTQEAYRTEAFSNLVTYLPAEHLPEALRVIVQSIKTPRHQTIAIENLIPFLSLQGFQDVLNLLEDRSKAQSEDNPLTEVQTKVIAEPKLKARILRSVATALSAASIDSGLSQPLSPEKSEEVLTPQLQRQVEISLLIDKIYNLTVQLQIHQQQDVSYEKEAADILSQMAPAFAYLSDQNRESIPDFVLRFKDLGYQAQVLSVCAPYFPKVTNQFLEECSGDDYRALLNVTVRAALLNQLHTQTRNEIAAQKRKGILKERDETLNQINTTLTTIEGQYRKAEALVEVARHPAGSGYQTEALQTIRGLSNTYLKVQYLQHLIPGLLDNERLEAANIIREISDSHYKVKAFVALACKFPEFRTEAKTTAQALENRVQRIEQLSALAVEVPEILPDIIDIAEEAEEQIERKGILVALVPHLPLRINREVNRERSAGRPITNDLWERALYLLARSYRDALQGGSLRNESAQDKDFLNLQDEINALSDLLLMRDLEPPMTVGILGGWGGGKSYIMHLMQAHITNVRSRLIAKAEAWNPDSSHEKLSPYVGHIYQIKFDAWTFAKSNLWASLMQTIFFELNRQITLEQKLQKFFDDNGIDPYAKNSPYGSVWKVLYQVRDEERDYFLERVLQKPDLENLDPAQQDKIDKLLWKKRDIVKQAATEEWQRQEAALKDVNDSLKQKQEQLEAVKTQLEASQEPKAQQLVEQVNQILVVSGVLLRKRIGDDAFDEFHKYVTEHLPADLSPESLQRFGGDLRLFISNILEGTDADGKPFNFSLKVLKQWGGKNLAFIIIFCGFAAASVLAPFLVAWKLPGAVVPQIVAFVAPLLPAIGMAQKLWRAGQRWYDQTKQALLDCETQIKGSQAVIKRETQRFQKHQEERIATLQANIDQLTKKAQALKKQVKVAREAVPENVYASLPEFVANRIKEGVYNQHLGLMHLVKEDLTNLSYRLLPPQLGSEEYLHKLDDLKAVFPRGPARVVVYIDDLDRCPPDRVVQVLEAVQLLVKTPLFIVVLAVDERYITRALEKFYEGVLSRRGRPSGTDYLEKIIQLPYRVRPIMANNLESYLRSQVVIQDSATGGAKFSEFSRQEFNMLLACCKQVDLSPRTLKRLTNVYKLFKIVCRTRGTKPSPQVQKSILALLALSGRYPRLMRGIFDSIETCFEEQRTPEKVEQRTAEKAEKTLRTLHLRSPLQDFFKYYQLPEGDRYLQREFEKLRHDADLHTNILPSTLTLEDMTHEIFNLIRSFSFVGEIGEDPEDYRIIGSTVDDQSKENVRVPDSEVV